MKASEIRLFNLVSKVHSSDILKVVGIDIDSIDTKFLERQNTPMTIWDKILIEDLRPIPLTEEWLLKFGFNKRSEQFGIRVDEYGFLNIYTDTFRYGLSDINSGDDFKSWDNKIAYVHQLQNLYFALTGEELSVQ